MRGVYKTDTYFKELVEKSNQDIAHFEELVAKVCAQRGESDRGVRNGFYTLLSRYENRFRILYSEGNHDAVLKHAFLGRLHYYAKTWDKEDGCLELIDVLSLAIALGISIKNEDLSVLLQKIHAANYRDYFVDVLARHLDPTWQGNCQEFICGEEMEIIRRILRSPKDEAVTLLAEYLRNVWYDLHEDCSWYESHKGKGPVYYGYWAFDAVAIVKILGLDDAKLKQEQYYPYDLAHMSF